MKQKIKTYLKYGLFLFGIVIFIYSCQKDDIDNYENSSHIKVNPYNVSFSKFKEHTKITNLSSYLKSKTSQSDARVDVTFNDFLIDTTTVNHYLLDSERSSFSFKIILKDSVVDGETYNLFIRERDNQWVSSIMLFVEDNDTSNNTRFSHIEEVYTLDGIHARQSNHHHNNSVARGGGGTWSETNIYHCTNTGECSSGVCDLCYRCVSTVSISFTQQGDFGDDVGGSSDNGIDGGMYNGGGGAGSYYDPNDSNTNHNEEEEDVITDCNLLENLSASPDFANKMQELINNTSGNTEITYFGNTDENGTTSLPIRVESEEGVRGIDIGVNSTEQIDVFMHNHFNNGQGSLSVFSGSDLFTLYQLYLNGNITDVDNYVMLVATPGGSGANDEETVYAITINNESSFSQFGANFLHEYNLIDLIYDSKGNKISPNISNSLNEERFTKLLNTFNSGLTIFKGDKDDLSNWSKLKVTQSNNITNKDCN
ncbi:hypothetical protein JAO71_04390 [Olleya sp. YSTF-M6]|uniref:Lipoprotein n=1 Tax=Olleya sediminilitoris TaxID=2795739 RepID=A0ABS1WIT3_9FLAO|nr:hypothetical protein [Olleya sediminilitoris]MBL7559035.1 hypothetical protein [Olleya sediminilitoris]